MTASRTVLMAGAALAVAAAGCPEPSPPGKTPPAVTTPAPPVRIGSWTYHGVPQGLSAAIHDVSADEGGNVYVAAGDAVFAKARAGETFLRFDAENAGLSTRCNDDAAMFDQTPPRPFFTCPIISVAGASPGKALIGFDGYGWEADGAAEWAKNTGGVDVVAFDPVAGKMKRTRHVLTAAPPHVVCDYDHAQWVDTCEPPPGTDPLPSLPWWEGGRRLFRRVNRIAVNHDPSTLMYGDAWMGGGHATLAVLLNDTGRRNWKDTTAGFDPMWADAKDFWEHHHPIIDVTLPDGSVTQHFGAGYAMSIDPRNGMPWASNGVRTATVAGYGPDLTFRAFGMVAIDLWPDGDDPSPVDDAQDDFVRGLAHCADGTMWAASRTHGLARVDTAGKISYLRLPGGSGAVSVACDWSDGSLWIGRTGGGVLRWKGGAFETVAVNGAPAFASHEVRNIQIDRWSAPGRVVYFAFGATDSSGGVAAYDGR